MLRADERGWGDWSFSACLDTAHELQAIAVEVMAKPKRGTKEQQQQTTIKWLTEAMMWATWWLGFSEICCLSISIPCTLNG